ncbi:hypothetical protein POM88_012697 [Heracleum sosnowskyi]|uniref:RNase H type-1 domain-containing protein n=1 Tax=Heracleum sosnowskyi TaxID=360622 RepID=A0AAD8IZJ0_9APIA|nr:hypothetical protein POM88_012697 [Heracleum sosnowskyi]
MLSDYKKETASQREQPTKVKVDWSPPDRDCILMNVDASFQKSNCSGGIGVVARDHEGRVIDASSKYLSFVPNVLASELSAIKGVMLAVKHGWKRRQVRCCSRGTLMYLKNACYIRAALSLLILSLKMFSIFKLLEGIVEDGRGDETSDTDMKISTLSQLSSIEPQHLPNLKSFM